MSTSPEVPLSSPQNAAFPRVWPDLASLLAPISPEAFLEEYWERKPLHIRGGPGKFRGLFDRAAFDQTVSSAGALHASFDATDVQKMVKIQANQAGPL